MQDKLGSMPEQIWTVKCKCIWKSIFIIGNLWSYISYWHWPNFINCSSQKSIHNVCYGRPHIGKGDTFLWKIWNTFKNHTYVGIVASVGATWPVAPRLPLKVTH